MADKLTEPSKVKWELEPYDFARSNLIFTWFAYARIVARKHNMPPPEPRFDDLSNEEIETSIQLLRDLAHLPPM